MKMLLKIVLIIFILIALTAGWFYLNYRVKYLDVSHELPYSKIIGKELVLERDVALIRKKTPDFHKDISEIVDEESEMSFNLESYLDSTKIVEVIKKGTRLTLTKAALQSGADAPTHGVIYGVLYAEQYNISFKQEWGEETAYPIDQSSPRAKNTSPFLFYRPIWESEKEFGKPKNYWLPTF